MNPITIRTILREQSLLLQPLYGDLAVLESRILLCEILNCTRSDLILNAEWLISEDEQAHYKELISRRLQGEPIAKIRGRKEFWGLSFKVTTDTLDPRPDTETLIEAVLDYVENGQKSSRILDLGAGTGCLLLTLLHELKTSAGVAVDISEKALSVAKMNAAELGLENRAEFILSDWGEKIDGHFDIIVSNPPYITEAEYEDLSVEVRNFDPYLALVSGSDGLECYRKIAPLIDKHLELNGFFAIEIGINQENAVASILKENNLVVLEIRKDLAGILRTIIGRRA